MSPYEACFDDYRTRCPNVDFMRMVGLYLQFGTLYANDVLFAMGRAIDRHAPIEQIENPAFVFDDPNCWHIACFWGQAEKLWPLLPYPLGFVSWYKTKDDRKELHVFSIERLRRFHFQHG